MPPKSAERFLSWFIKGELLEEILGDLYEYHEELLDKPSWKRKLLYWFHVFNFLRPFAIKKSNSYYLNHAAMFRHNFLITYRTYLRNKSLFIINLSGLSTGLAAVLLVYLWVSNELSVDAFHQKDNQLYQVMQNFQLPDDILTMENTPLILGEAMVEEMPEVESAASISVEEGNPEGIISHIDENFEVKRLFVSKNFFDIFSYHLIEGDPDHVLANKNNIAISKELAIKLFGSTEDVIGKTVEWNNQWSKEPFQVTGVFSAPPASATMQFDALTHYDWRVAHAPHLAKWTSGEANTFLRLKEGTNIKRFNEKITNYLKPKHPSRENSTLFVQQYSKRYLHGKYENGLISGGRIVYVRLFSIIALFILLIACINFMNLSTAQAAKKMKEIGVKKAIGANRRTLIWQFLSESTLMAMLSLIVSVGLVIFILPQFNEITGKSLQLHLEARVILSAVSLVLLTGLLAGSYPAFYLSGFKSVSVLKGSLNFSAGSQWIRKGLVVFQFALSVIFIVGVLVINRQMEYTQTKNLGYMRDNILCFQRPHHKEDAQLILSKLQQIPGVVNTSHMVSSILDDNSDQSGFSWNGQASERDYVFKSPMISYNVIETLGMEILAGRSFSREYNDEDESKIILNESALRMMQLADPVNKKISYGSDEKQIIGVVSDFHYGSIHHEIEPLIFRFRDWGHDIMVKIKAGTEKTTVEEIEHLYKGIYPNSTFDFTFLDQDYQKMYEEENRVAVLSKYFSGLAIIISCLGLFGLVAFTVERRTKEMGIRKVLGSSVFGIIAILSKDFTKMVVIAIVIALPVSYLMAREWLNSFAYRIELEWWFFAVSGLLALLISWTIIGWQARKVANANPVKCLKDE